MLCPCSPRSSSKGDEREDFDLPGPEENLKMHQNPAILFDADINSLESINCKCLLPRVELTYTYYCFKGSVAVG